MLRRILRSGKLNWAFNSLEIIIREIKPAPRRLDAAQGTAIYGASLVGQPIHLRQCFVGKEARTALAVAANAFDWVRCVPMNSIAKEAAVIASAKYQRR